MNLRGLKLNWQIPGCADIGGSVQPFYSNWVPLKNIYTKNTIFCIFRDLGTTKTYILNISISLKGTYAARIFSRCSKKRFALFFYPRPYLKLGTLEEELKQLSEAKLGTY